MRVTVDPEKCIGSGNCENAASSVFRLGVEGLVEVLDSNPDASLGRRVRGAAKGCPTGAITVDEGSPDGD